MLAKSPAITIAALSLALGIGANTAIFRHGQRHPAEAGPGVGAGPASALLGGVALVASFIPAWRATRIDPLIALRTE